MEFDEFFNSTPAPPDRNSDLGSLGHRHAREGGAMIITVALTTGGGFREGIAPHSVVVGRR